MWTAFIKYCKRNDIKLEDISISQKKMRKIMKDHCMKAKNRTNYPWVKERRKKLNEMIIWI